MPNTYSQIYIQIVFVVKYRSRLINKEWKEDLLKYMTGIIKNNNHILLKINCVEDHVHLLISLKPNQSISDLMKEVKGSSSKWINEMKLVKGKFEWQEGFGAFSYSHSQIKNVIKYIEKQEEHHKKTNFREEYLDFLKKFEVDYNVNYIFKELE